MIDAVIDPSHLSLENGVFFQRGSERQNLFEEKYIQLRDQENRLYPDAVVAQLPTCNNETPHANEWKARRASMQLLINYFQDKRPKAVLEIGCGNGWLSNCLAATTAASVTGFDCNETELTQAARVFQRNKLSFVYGDIFTCPLIPGSIDVIVMASSLQYFESVEKIIERCLELLSGHGEVHIVDTPMYHNDATAAAERSRSYFEKIGMPDMSTMYFHHTRNSLNPYKPDIMFDPASISSKVQRNVFGKMLPVFPWLRICKEKN